MKTFLLSLLCFFPLFGEDLVNIQYFNDNIVVDMRYATTLNMLQQPIYPSHYVYLDGYVATRLGRVQKDLAKEGLGLIVYEGYRPPSVQAFLNQWRCKHCHHTYQFDDAPHYRKGLGVDVAIYYMSGQPLELPTAWGHDCARAYRDFPFLECHVFHNSAILEKIMVQNGFVPMRERWWHFDLKGWELAPDLNLEYCDLINK